MGVEDTGPWGRGGAALEAAQPAHPQHQPLTELTVCDSRCSRVAPSSLTFMLVCPPEAPVLLGSVTLSGLLCLLPGRGVMFLGEV